MVPPGGCTSRTTRSRILPLYKRVERRLVIQAIEPSLVILTYLLHQPQVQIQTVDVDGIV